MCFPDSAGNAWHIFDHEWLMDLPTPGIVDKAIKDRTAQLENEGWNGGYNNGYKAGALEGSGGLWRDLEGCKMPKPKKVI